jgi:hypothetical protein
MRIYKLYLCAVILTTSNVYSQKVLPNTLVGKKELAISGSFTGSNYSEIALPELTYRWPVSKKMKIGGGAKLFWGGLNTPDYTHFNIYPALFADAVRFIGSRQKWSVNLQFGYEFYKDRPADYHGYDPTGAYIVTNNFLKAGFYSNIGIYHRAILSSRVQFVSGAFLSTQHTTLTYLFTNSMGITSNTHRQMNLGGGIKIGLVMGLGK